MKNNKGAGGMLTLVLLLVVIAVLVIYFFNFVFIPKSETPTSSAERITSGEQATQKIADIGKDLQGASGVIDELERTLG